MEYVVWTRSDVGKGGCLPYQVNNDAGLSWMDVSTGPSGTCMGWDGDTARKRWTNKQTSKQVIYEYYTKNRYIHNPSQSIYIHL